MAYKTFYYYFFSFFFLHTYYLNQTIESFFRIIRTYKNAHNFTFIQKTKKKKEKKRTNAIPLG